MCPPSSLGDAVQHDFWIEIGADATTTRSETYVQADESESETITYERVSPGRRA